MLLQYFDHCYRVMIEIKLVKDSRQTAAKSGLLLESMCLVSHLFLSKIFSFFFFLVESIVVLTFAENTQRTVRKWGRMSHVYIVSAHCEIIFAM